MPVVLYKRQRQIFNFIKQYIGKHGYAPSLKEIAKAHDLSSLATVHEHIRRLVEKGVLEKQDGVKRGLEVVKDLTGENESAVTVPIMGFIAAGLPIQPYTDPNAVFKLAPAMVSPKRRSYVLQVKGDSMVEDGILDGDYVVIEETDEVKDGEIVVALLENGTVTLKKIYREETRVRLEPANADMGPIFAANVTVQGRVVGLVRRFHKYN